ELTLRSFFGKSGASVDLRRASSRLLQIDPIQQRIELHFVQFDVRRSSRWGVQETKAPRIQPLVEQAHPRAIPEQDLDGLSSLPEEDEERSAARVVPERLPGDPREAVEPTAQVDGLERQKDLGPGGDHCAPFS